MIALCLSARSLFAGQSPPNEPPSKRLSGGVHAFIISGSYANPADTTSAESQLDEKFKTAGDAFETYLRRVIPTTELTEIVRLTGSSATKKEVEKILQGIRKIQDNSLIIFYFCGHGFRQGDLPKEAAPDAPDTRATCLALYGCDKAGKVSNSDDVSLPTSSIASVLDAKPNLNFMVFLDCCHSGADVPLLRGSDKNSYAINNRGFFLASSSRDEVSRNCDFTEALLKVWRDGKFDRSETLKSFVAKVSAAINEGKPIASQLANPVLGNLDLPLGLVGLDSCVLFLQLSPPPAPSEYLLSIKPSAGLPYEVQQSPGTTMLLLTVPRKECALKIAGAFKTWEGSVNLSGRPYYPLQVVLKGPAMKAAPLPAQQAAMEADYNSVLAQANSMGVPLATIGLEAISLAHSSQPLLDTVPLIRTFLGHVDESKDEVLAQTDTVRAARFLVRNEDFPVTAEGRTLATALQSSEIGGDALLSRFNYKCVELIKDDPDRAARELAFANGDAAKNNLGGFYANALRHALVSQDESLIRNESKRTLFSLRSKASLLSTTDLEQISKLQRVAVATYEKRGTPVPPEDKAIGLNTINKVAGYQKTIRASAVFKDDQYSAGKSANKLMTGLINNIDSATYGSRNGQGLGNW